MHLEGGPMKKIQNTIVFKTGDAITIYESDTLPLKDKVMYKIKNSEKNAVIVTRNGETIIPVDNILFATSSPLDIEESESDRYYEI